MARTPKKTADSPLDASHGKQCVADAARICAGSTAPTLARKLAHAAKVIKKFRLADESRLTRSEAKRALDLQVNSVKRLRNSEALLALLHGGASSHNPALADVVDDLVKRAETARAAIPDGQGPRVVPLRRGHEGDNLDPRVLTAAFINEAWLQARARNAPANSTNASDAARLLWAASGGDADDNLLWRRPFEEVHRILNEPIDNESKMNSRWLRLVKEFMKSELPDSKTEFP